MRSEQDGWRSFRGINNIYSVRCGADTYQCRIKGMQLADIQGDITRLQSAISLRSLRIVRRGADYGEASPAQ
jgi:hypothetical protein